MFVRSRPNSPPRLDRFTILSSASYARASLAHAVDDLKAIEFFFFLLQQYSPSRVPFILFDSLSLKPFYITVEIFFFSRSFPRFFTPTRPFIYQHPSTRWGISKGAPNAASLNTRYSLERTRRSPRNFTPRVTISRYVFAVQCAPRSAVRISSFLFHECTYARMFLHAAYRPTFLSRPLRNYISYEPRYPFHNVEFFRVFFFFFFFLLFPWSVRARIYQFAR